MHGPLRLHHNINMTKVRAQTDKNTRIGPWRCSLTLVFSKE